MHEAQAFFIVVTVAALFMAPTWLAPRGRRWSVGLVNVLLGWSIIGWVVALVMAVRARETAQSTRKE